MPLIWTVSEVLDDRHSGTGLRHQRRVQIEHRLDHRGVEHRTGLLDFVQDLRRTAGVGHYAFRSVRVDGDKLTRALAWLNLAEEGKVILVRGPWIDEFVDEVCRFPSTKHDDQVDAVSIAVAMLERMGGRAWGIS